MRYTQKGFTLVESLVYIALFVAVSTASFVALLQYQALFQQYLVHQALFQTGTHIMERVLLEIREAEEIDHDVSEWEVDEGRLVLRVDDEEVIISLDDGSLQLHTVDAVTALNDNQVYIDTFRVYSYTSDNVTLVRVQLQATSQRDAYQETWEWESAAVARGTYSE